MVFVIRSADSGSTTNDKCNEEQSPSKQRPMRRLGGRVPYSVCSCLDGSVRPRAITGLSVEAASGVCCNLNVARGSRGGGTTVDRDLIVRTAYRLNQQSC